MVLLAHEAGLGDAPPGFSVNAVPPPEGTDDPMKEWRARAAEFRSRMVTEFGEDRLAAREAEEQSRMKAEQESQDRRELVGIANNAGLSVEEFESFYDSVKGMEAELSERFASALRDASTPEEREVVEAEQEAELEGIAADLLGEEKARRLIDALRARTGQ
jgi:ribosomal protein L34